MEKKDVVFIFTAIILVALLLASSLAYIGIEEDYSSLSGEYARLESRYGDLLKEYTALVNDYQELERRLSSLSIEYQKLESDHKRLQGEYDAIKEEYGALAVKNQELESRYLEQEARYLELNASYIGLEREYRELKGNYTALGEKFSNIESKLEAMSLRVLISGEALKIVLNQSRIKEVDDVVYRELRFSPGSSPSTKAVKIFEWIILNTQYVSDQYHPYYWDESIDYAWEYLQPVNETLGLGRGDCEDLAVLAYAMLRPVLTEGEELYLVILENAWIRHVAVLYKSGGLFLIVDPAGNYVSDGMLVLEVAMRRADVNELAVVRLIPAGLSPSFKLRLIEDGFAEPKYVRLRDGLPATPGKFSGIEEVVINWIGHWREDMPGAYISMVANETYTRTFSSTSEFIGWIKG